MTEYIRPSTIFPGDIVEHAPTGTEGFRRHLRMKTRACPAWRSPLEYSEQRDRAAQLAALEHLAERGLPGQGMDVDVVREFWRDHPEHRDLAVHCAPPQV